ncbi:hypothetical protein [uncultured Pontibacter sp.]|uniref:hypothetical protein n=1 Tax=uncultured Pontibacter sp. TaxID=453356 RepID=UPI0026103DA3|nr:hypothetical protein [uncultured Pontibacter sp.]
MNAIAIIISLIALVGAGFAFLRASSSHRIMTKRVEKQKDRIDILEERLRRLEGNSSRGRRSAEESQEDGRRNQPRQERHEQQEQRHEERQKQRSKKGKSERQPQERTQQDEQPQERQQERRQRERQSTDMPPQSQERAPEDRTTQERHTQQQEEGQQRRPKRDNRRRNEPRDASQSVETDQESGSTPVNLEIAGGSLLDELEQEAASANSTVTAPSAPIAADEPFPSESPANPGKAYAIIPEDGLIRQHQLQQQPDSDSYIEVDVPKDGGNMTYYRFNLAGNHAFVISQGIDRLENAFSFEKPSNRMVSQVVQQHDGVLAKVGNGWKIEQKARIDFR